MRENVIRIASVPRSHVALTALPRQVAPASTMPKRVTTPAPPHVNGPQGSSFQTGAAHNITRGPPRSDRGEKASMILWKSVSTVESLNRRVNQEA